MGTSNPYRALFLGGNWINGKINTQNMNCFRPDLISGKYTKPITNSLSNSLLQI